MKTVLFTLTLAITSFILTAQKHLTQHKKKPPLQLQYQLKALKEPLKLHCTTKQLL
ncbi:MAG: hypothetical protein ACWA45_03815 [Flavobacteriales bacterium]